MLDFVAWLSEIKGINKTWGRWSGIVEVTLPDTASFETYLENILQVMVCKWPVTLVGCKIYGKYIWEESESINSFVWACLSYFSKSTLKSPRRKTFFFSFGVFL